MNLELVREIEGWNGFTELYKYADGYIVVSTVVLKVPSDPGLAMITGAGTAIGRALGDELAQPGEEETQAFHSNAEGRVFNWRPIVSAAREGSRDKVLQQLTTR